MKSVQFFIRGVVSYIGTTASKDEREAADDGCESSHDDTSDLSVTNSDFAVLFNYSCK